MRAPRVPEFVVVAGGADAPATVTSFSSTPDGPRGPHPTPAVRAPLHGAYEQGSERVASQLSVSEARAFHRAIGVEVDSKILLRALTHRSYAYEKGGLPT
ncbi:ribonuclease III, partial [Nocardiopsis tropica]|nr:ribonuclease III [Nocardiopsis tropica]